jgi:hypothetical protein
MKDRWWYLSFAGSRGWNGGVVLEADDLKGALKKAARMDCNPGGEVKATELNPVIPPPTNLINRLIRSRSELDQLCKKWIAEDESIRSKN